MLSSPRNPTGALASSRNAASAPSRSSGGAGADHLLVVAGAGHGDEGDVLVEIDVAQALGLIVGERARAPEEAHIDILRRHAVEHELHAVRVAAAGRPKHDLLA
jgi:hypothetical protein